MSTTKVFDGRIFKADRFAGWLANQNMSWPLLESGRLDLSDDAFRQQAKAYPQVSPLRELRSALSDLRLNDLAVGKDGRNRTILSAFRSRTGRNQPSNTRFIFGPSVWLRGLIKPPPGYGVAYVDWSQQEVGIAAVLSGDAALIEAYKSGDVYLAFAKQARAVPPDATKKSHGPQRELFKQCVLATQYGQGEDGLAQRIGQPRAVARELLRAHRETYRTFWRWSDAAVDAAMLTGSLHTVFGWHVHIGENPNPRSLRNFPMQANGAEMMRLAACLATERGIEVCAPVHDACLICAPLDRIGQDIAAMRAAMAEASRTVLNGFEVAGWSRGEDRMSHNVPNDMKDLVLTEAEVAAAMKAASEGSTPRKLRTRSKSKFIMFPVEWQFQLARVRADGCTYRVALYLLWEAWRSQSNRVKLTNVGMKEHGVSRWNKHRALKQLVEAGLISVEQRTRKSPSVTVKFTD